MAFDPLTAILDVSGKVLDRVLPDKAANDAAKAKLIEMQTAGELAQITGQLDVDKTEAASNSVFVAGWRPFIGWVCGVGLGYQFIGRPLFQAITDIVTVLMHSKAGTVNWQSLDIGTLMTLLFGMLGMATARTIDKINGVGNGH